MVSKKKNPLVALRWDRKIIPGNQRRHHSASLVILLTDFFLSHPHTQDRFLYSHTPIKDI